MSNSMLSPVQSSQATLATRSHRKPSTDPIRDEHRQAERTGKHRHDHEHDDDDHRRPDRSERPARRNPLVNAMMQALQGLVSAGGTPASTAANAGAAPAAGIEPATDEDARPAVRLKLDKAARHELKDAAAAFAHELFNALRGDGESDEVERHHPGRGHHFGHRHRHGGGAGIDRFEGGYSDLVGRLQELAASLQQPQATGGTDPVAAPVVAAAPAAASIPDSPIVPWDPPAVQQTTPPAEQAAAGADSATESAAAPNIAVGISVEVNITVEFQAFASPLQPASPLLAAFENLLRKLPIPAPDPAAVGQAISPVERLRQFLLGIAESLQAALPGREEQALQPQAGSLVDVTA